jgi:hypothetical protein
MKMNKYERVGRFGWAKVMSEALIITCGAAWAGDCLKAGVRAMEGRSNEIKREVGEEVAEVFSLSHNC